MSELALQMWETLNYQKIDAAILSRVINGERLFTPQQLEVFCKILNLNRYEIYHMRMALYEDYYRKYGLELDLSVSPYFLDLVKMQLKKILLPSQAGHPTIALELIDTLTEQIDVLITSHHSSLSHPIYKLQVQALLKKIRIYRDILLPSVTIPYIKPLVAKIFVIAKSTEDKQLLGTAYSSLGCAYHIANQHEKAIDNFEKALAFTETPKEKLVLLRHLSISLAYLQRKTDFISVQNKMLASLQKLNTNDPRYLCEILEGLSRAQGILTMPQAFDTWKEAKTITQQMTKKKLFVRHIQLTRTHLEIVKALEPTEKKYLHTNAKVMQQIALEHGYKRHAKLIAKFI